MDNRIKNAYRLHASMNHRLEPSLAVSLFYRYLYSLFDWTTVDSYLCYEVSLAALSRLTNEQAEWRLQLEQLSRDFEILYNSYVEQYGKYLKGDKRLSTDVRLEIEQELMHMNPIHSFQQGIMNESDLALINEIKDLVQKGNRSSFKLIQELQQRLEELAVGQSGNTKANVAEILEKSELQVRELTHLLLETFDMLDLVRKAVKAKGDETWIRELNLVIETSLTKLNEYGLEVLDVQDQIFDGEIMEGISTVSVAEVPVDYQRYQVFEVVRCGFRYKPTGELIRKARVTTVY